MNLANLPSFNPARELQALRDERARREAEARSEFMQREAATLEERLEQIRMVQSEPGGLLEFVRYFWDVLEPGRDFVDGWPIEAVCEHLEAVTDGKIKRLLINVPPGFMKSLLVSVYHPAWTWTACGLSHKRFLSFSYSPEITQRDNSKFLALLRSDRMQELYGNTFELVEKSRYKVSNTAFGSKIASSVGGVTTGERADCVICFPGDALVHTDLGRVPIADIVNDKRSSLVWSTDVRHGSARELKPVIGWHRNPASMLVRVELDDGSTLRCTPDHRLWTLNRGWVAAVDLQSCDMLPDFAGSDFLDRRSGDAEIGRERVGADLALADRFNHVLLQDCVSAKLSVRYVGRKADGDAVPCFAASDCLDDASTNSVTLGEFGSGLATGSNLGSLSAVELGARPLLKDGERAVQLGVSDVLRSGSVGDVGGVVVAGVSVEVPDVEPLQLRSDKCPRNRLMNEGVNGGTVYTSVKPCVSLAVVRSGQDALGDGKGVGVAPAVFLSDSGSGLASDASEAGHAVKSFEARYRKPLFVAFDGHAEETFCLSVADNNTFWCGNGRGFLVSNCDDPHNVKDAESQLVREGTVRWFQESMQNRLNDLGESSIIVIMQRVHEADVAGTIIDHYPSYTHLCYDAETEVLTKDGWVAFPNLIEGHEVLAVSPHSLQARWEMPTHYIKNAFRGDLIHYKSLTCDLLVTPEHRVVYKDPNDWRYNRTTDWRVRAAKDLPQNFYLPQAVAAGDGCGDTVNFAKREWRSDVFAEFMGWYLAEGCSSIERCITRIVQKNGTNADEIEDILRACPFKFRRAPHGGNDMTVFSIGSKDLALELAPLGDSLVKRMPALAKTLGAKDLQKMIVAYVKGDGHALTRNASILHAASRSKRLIDDFQECCVRSGWSATVNVHYCPPREFNGYTMPGGFMYKLYIRASKSSRHERKWYSKIGNQNIHSHTYDGTVYCVSVPSTALLVRRNGRVTVCGNCVPMEYDPRRHCETQIGDETWSDPRTEDGELAWPERFSDKNLDQFRITRTLWATQYQQSPAPRGGGIIKRDDWRPWDEVECELQGVPVQKQLDPRMPGGFVLVPMFPPFEFVVASLDTAYTEKQENDPCALTVWGVWKNKEGLRRIMLCAAWATRFEFHPLIQETIRTCKRFHPDVLLIEAKAAGHSVAQEVRRLAADEPWSIRMWDPGRGDKVARAYAVQPMFEAGLIYAPDKTWSEMVISECATFPRSAHDDLVDTTTQALAFLRSMGMAQLPQEVLAQVERDLTNWKRPKPLYAV